MQPARPDEAFASPAVVEQAPAATAVSCPGCIFYTLRPCAELRAHAAVNSYLLAPVLAARTAEPMICSSRLL